MGAVPSGAATVERLGRYQVIGRIAQGGMAEVLLAKLVGPQGFERPIVIKRMLPQLATDRTFVEMFLDEAKLVAGIRHPNVVQVNELSEDGEFFLVMEYLAGESAASLMKRLAMRKKRVPFAVCAYIVAEAAAGLHAAHELRGSDGQLRNVVHRDISPQNLFVTYDGAIKVIDFGIAKATDRMTKTEAGQLKGKFAYMAPESCRGGRIDRRTDLFSLATVLYEISTGTRLFVRSTDMKTLEAVCYEPIRPPSAVVKDYPKELEAVVMKGLERDPAARYQTAADMRRDLVRASHALMKGGLPDEQLKNAMHSLFSDRIEEKEEMLRRVRSGARLDHIPMGEVDGDVSIPMIVDERIGALTAPSMTGMRPVKPPEELGDRIRFFVEQQERWKLLAAGGVGALVLIVALSAIGSWFRSSSAPDDAPAATVYEPSTPAVPDRADVASPAGQVQIQFDTKPSGASVSIEGVYRGMTPLELTFDRTDNPVGVRFELPGYEPMMETVVPNVSQRLGFALVSEPAPKARGSKRSRR